MLVSLVLSDAGTAAAMRWFARDRQGVVLSDFTWGELTATVGREVRSRRLSNHDALEIIKASRNALDDAVWLFTTAADVLAATEIMFNFDLGLRLPDAIHLAIARRHAATLITTDKRQGDAAAVLGIGYVDPTRPA